MEKVAVQFAIDPARVGAALEEARATLENAGAIILDFGAVPRLSACDIRALEELGSAAAEKGIRIVLRGVGSSLYKVLKLIKLSSRFGFAN